MRSYESLSGFSTEDHNLKIPVEAELDLAVEPSSQRVELVVELGLTGDDTTFAVVDEQVVVHKGTR